MSFRVSLPVLGLSAAVLTLSVIAGVAAPRATAQAAPKGNAAIGAKLFLQCRACHTVEVGGRNGVGPNLAGVMGAKAAFHPGYKYSPALQKTNLTWNAATMDAWLKRPSAVAPGNKMAFGGVADPAARANLIAYLATLKGKK